MTYLSKSVIIIRLPRFISVNIELILEEIGLVRNIIEILLSKLVIIIKSKLVLAIIFRSLSALELYIKTKVSLVVPSLRIIVKT